MFFLRKSPTVFEPANLEDGWVLVVRAYTLRFVTQHEEEVYLETMEEPIRHTQILLFGNLDDVRVDDRTRRVLSLIRALLNVAGYQLVPLPTVDDEDRFKVVKK